MQNALLLADFVLMQCEFLLNIYEDSDFKHDVVRFINFEIDHKVILFDLRH